jgi:hypothetical protein
LNPLTIDALSRIMSSLLDRFLDDTGSTNRCIREYGAIDGEASAATVCVTLEC